MTRKHLHNDFFSKKIIDKSLRIVKPLGLSFAFLMSLLFSSNLSAQVLCDSSFTGLTTPVCSVSPIQTLIPANSAGTFSGPGIVGTTFDPALAGPGTHTITYTLNPNAGYSYSSIPYALQPAVANMVTLGDDDITASLPIGFTFNFYGINYTQFEISSNGFITFDLGTFANGCCSGQILPDFNTPNNLVAAIWDDLYPPGNGTVGYSTVGTAPNRKLIVSWNSIPFCCTSTADVTSTIVLYETTNVIEVHTASVNNAQSATMGIENAGGTLATVVPGYNSSIINGTNIGARFTPSVCSNFSTQTVVVNPSPTPIVTASPSSICPGGSSTLSATGAISYIWLPANQAGPSITVTPATTTVYTITATGANGCTNTITNTINVNANLPITAASNPQSICLGSSATITASGATTYTWMPGNLTGNSITVNPLVTTVYTITGSNSPTCTGSGTFTMQVVNMSGATITPNTTPCTDTLTASVTGGVPGPPNPGARYYIRDTDPWSTTNNTTAMDAVFGAGNFTTTDYASAVPATVFSPATQFVFLEGSDGNPLSLNTYITANITVIENWVNAGGRLFLNAAPNSGGNMNWGFGGVVLNYANAQSNVTATMPAHPIYSGPFTPVTTSYSGGSYSHAYITGGATTSLLAGTGFDVLTQKTWGAGFVMFGGITSPNFHTPAIEAQNLWQNIISYCATSSLAPSYTYLWSNAAVTQSITPTAVGTYTVTITNSGCTGTATYTLTNAIPNVVATANNMTICPGVSSTLSATGASTYTWMPGSLSGASVNVTPLVTTTYTVTGTGANGCTKTSTIMITVTGQLPITASASPASVCLGSSSTITASGANTYTWMPGNLSGTNVTITPTATTTYTVTGTNALGCTGSTTLAVSVVDLSSLTIVHAGVNCLDTLKALVTGGIATGNKYYIRDTDPWSTTNNTTAMTAVFGAANYSTLTFATAVPATVFSPATQFVFLEGSDANAIGLNTYLTANITTIENWVNAGGRLFLNAAPNGGTNMNWGFGGVVLNYSNPQSAVTATAPAHPIYVGPFVPVTTSYTGGSYSHAYITGGATTSLLAGGGFDVLTEKTWGAGRVMFGGITSPNFHTPAIEAQNLWQNIISYCSGGNGPQYTYLWNTNAVTSSIVPTASGTYTVTVTSGACSATATTTIIINTPPVISVNATPASICPGLSSTLAATGAVSYIWMPGNLSGPSVTVTPGVTTTYTVTATGASGCTTTFAVTVQVTGLLPIVATAVPATICPGGTSTIIASGANTYTWMPGSLNGATQTVNPAATTTYTVTGTNAAGCTGSSLLTVTVSTTPTVTANASPSNSICQGDNVTLSGGGATTYTWTGGVVNGVAFAPAATTTYTVTGANAAGCTNNTAITVTVNPSATPGAAILASTPVNVLTGQSATFTVNIPAGVTGYTIHWYRSNVLINTTTSPTNTYSYTPTSLADSVYAWLVPTGCFNPDSVKTNTIKPKNPNGLNDITSPDGFELYPNPTNNTVFINGMQAGDQMVLTDVVGKTILTKSITSSDKFTFTMTSLANGVYYAKFTRDNKNWVIKIVKE